MLTILTTHPIQYQVPLWQALARESRIPFEVWYLSDHATHATRDREFGQTFKWDLDMLEGYPYRFIKTKTGATPNTFWRSRIAEPLPELFRARGTKAIWIQGWQVAAYWQAVWAAKKAGIEVWLRGESNDLAPTPFWKLPIKRFLLGQLFRRVDRFLYIGTANRRLYAKYGVASDRLYSAPYAVDNERFTKQANEIRSSKSEIRKQWGIAEDAFSVLFCGKFIRKKRPLDLVKAAQLLITNNRLPNIHLLFVGSGELGGQLREASHVVYDADAAHASLVTHHSPAQPKLRRSEGPLLPPASFTGFLNQTEISRAYVSADCLVLPSDYGETWGLVVNEAMASGLPCIISDRCGCAEDLGPIPPNFTYQCGDLRQLADRFVTLQANSVTTLSQDMLSRHSFRETVHALTQIYVRDEHSCGFTP